MTLSQWVLRGLRPFLYGLITLWSVQGFTADKTQEMIALLAQHLERARQLDGSYLAAQATKDAAWHEVEVATAALGFKVSASANGFYSDRTEESRGLGLTSEVDRNFWAGHASITLRKPIYRQRDDRGIDQAQAKFQAATAMFQAADHDLFGRVFLAWLEILTARDLLALSWEGLTRSSAVRSEVQRQFESGEATIDQLGLEMSREQQRWSEFAQAQSRLELAEAALSDLAGPEAIVPDGFTLESAVPSPFPFVSRESVLAAVDNQNPELQSARFSEEAARLERDKRNADFGPVVDLYMVASKGENDAASYIKDEQRIGIQVSIPLYTSGGLKAAVAQADADYRKMQSMTHAIGTRLRSKAATAFAQMQSLMIRLDATNALIEATGLQVESARRGFNAGTMTAGDLARAESEFLAARERRANDMRDYGQSWTILSVTTAKISGNFGPRIALLD